VSGFFANRQRNKERKKDKKEEKERERAFTIHIETERGS
jgi:hypothetical protein